MWLKEFFRSPSTTASISQASPYLGKRIAQVAEIGLNDVVAEIGVGRGAITEFLLPTLNPKLYVGLDINEHVVKFAQKRFPFLSFSASNALDFPSLLAQQNHTKADVVISSLGLLSMKEELRYNIYKILSQSLSDQGRIIQYTYGKSDPLSPAIKTDLGLIGVPKGWVIKNIPPAQVFEYKKSPSAI